MDNNTEIMKTLLKDLKLQRVTQIQVAKELDIHPQLLTNWKSGIGRVSNTYLKATQALHRKHCTYVAEDVESEKTPPPQISQVEAKVYTPVELAHMLGISVSTVRSLALEGEIPSIKLGKKLRVYPKPRIDSWLSGVL